VIQVGPGVTVAKEYAGRVRRKRFSVGDVSIHSRETPRYVCRLSDANEYLLLGIAPSLLTAIGAAADIDRESLEIADHFGVRDTLVQHVAHALFRESSSPGLGGKLYRESILNHLVIHLVRTYSTSAKPLRADKKPPRVLARKHLNRAIELIHDSLERPLSLKEISEAANVSPYHFIRLFRKATGMSPHQYLLRQRLELARRLLIESQKPISEVASLAGFYDQSHLNYHFKRAFKMTPAAFRKNRNLPNK
jgi:AraC family transcriptional regulator